jgi:hypothetical protein
MNRAQPTPFIRSLRRLRNAFWWRRFIRWAIRAAWLAMVVPVIALTGYLWLGWQPQLLDWLVPLILVTLFCVIWAIRPLNLKQMVQRLDGRLGMRARLITAYEVSASPQADNPVVERLYLETVNAAINLRQQIHSFGRGFWLELQALIAVAALLTGLVVIDALRPDLPQATPVELPAAWQEPKADEVVPPDPQLFPPAIPPQVAAGQELSQEELQQALSALADALRDQAVTRSIAEALDRGDLAGAAEGLRRLADQLGGLSEQARDQLGQSLQQAAAQAGQIPGLTQPLEASGEALNGEDLNATRQALESLAQALESLQQAPQESAQTPPDSGGQSGQTEQPQTQGGEQAGAQEPSQAGQPEATSGSGAGAGEGEGNGPPSEAERLAVEGQPLELESEGDLKDQVLQPAELGAQAGDETTSDSPFARQPVGGTNRDLGPDPLTYPWQKRDVIRRYFTP